MLLVAIAVNTCLVRALLASGGMTSQQMQQAFEAAKDNGPGWMIPRARPAVGGEPFHRSRLPATPTD